MVQFFLTHPVLFIIYYYYYLRRRLDSEGIVTLFVCVCPPSRLYHISTAALVSAAKVMRCIQYFLDIIVIMFK